MYAHKRIANLDGLRFLAALIVVICHFDIIKSFYGFERRGWRFFNNAAQVAVTFFFVLSGFLITYLLLKEKFNQPAGRFRLFRFYGKRIRRIWPLYYLLVLLTFFLFTGISWMNSFHGMEPVGNTGSEGWNRFIGYLFFLPNHTEYFHGSAFFLGQTWSLGVEEFFYLFFPAGLWLVSKKKVLTYCLVLLIGFGLTATITNYLRAVTADPGNTLSILFVFFYKYRIYAFAAGAIAAWLIVKEEKTGMKRLSEKKGRLLAGIGVITFSLLILSGLTASFLTQQVYALGIAGFIYVTVSSGTVFTFLNHRHMIYLGKISYGIYMLHPVAIVTVLHYTSGWHPGQWYGETLLVLAAILMTILLSILSYEGMERFFIGRFPAKHFNG